MEMKRITTELEPAEDLGTSKQMLVTATNETEPYSKLQKPAEDVYSEAYYGSAPVKPNADKQTEGNIRLYRAVCVLLTIISLVLLLVVIILGVKLQTGSTSCPEIEQTAAADSRSSPSDSTCSHEQCHARFSDVKPLYRECRQCADGWLTLDESCFFLSTYKLSWEESQQNCTARGGALAVINSQTVQSFLTKEGRMKYWIGLKQIDDEWVWVNNTALGDSNYWAGTWPSEGCAILSSDSTSEKNWLSASCQSYTYFICQLHL